MYVEYFDHDGIYAGETDAQYLSLGISTWSQQDLSLKVWRKGGKNDVWLRQSEELPLHRPIDLVILLAAGMLKESNLPSNTLENQSSPLEIQVNPSVPHRVKSLEDYFEHNCGSETKGEVIRKRLLALKMTLDELSDKGLL